MSATKDVIRYQLQTGQFLLNKFTSDLSDADYFKSAVTGGNHAGWVMGHIACSEDSLLTNITGKAKRIPEKTHELFQGGSTCHPDASKYPSRKELDGLFQSSRALLMEALESFEEKRFNEPTPDEMSKEFKEFFPTLGAIWALMGTHQFWHIGQITDVRKALGKPAALEG